MTMTPEQALERLNKQYKRQNEHIKESYDRVSATLPKGTKERIKATGYSLNNFIAEAVKEKLEQMEAPGTDAADQPEQDSFSMNPPEEEQPDQKDIELPDCFK